jgi:two-component system response regulator YesN
MTRVVIVDDEPIIRKWFSMAIQNADRDFVVVGSAANGQEALEICSKEQVDVLVTDIQMPIMDGLTLIQEVRKTFPGIKVIILSNHEDFRYAKEAMKLGASDYLLKAEIEESELFDLLDNLRSEQVQADTVQMRGFDRERHALETIFLKNWLDGAEVESASIPNKLDVMGSGLKVTDMYLCLFRIDHYNRLTLEMTLEDKRQRAFTLIELMHKIMYQEAGNGVVFEYAENRIAMILNAHLESSKGIRDFLYRISSKIIKEVQEELGLGISAGISACGNSFAGAAVLREQAVQAIRSLYFGVERSVAFYKVPESSKSPKMQVELQRKLEEIRSELDQWNVEEAAAKARELLRDNAAYGELDPGEIRRAAIIIIRLFREKARRTSSEPESLLQEDHLVKEAEACDYLHTTREWMDCAVAEAVTAVGQGIRSNSAVSQAFMYIKRNYANEMSLSDVARFVHLTPAYLSALFKEQAGENFNHYLIRIRLDKAKELLMTTDMKITELAEAVGYPNASYFIRVFKKVEGISPMEFKNARLRK